MVDIQKQNSEQDKLEEQRKTSKIILKPIEIKDPRKMNREVSKEKPQRPASKIQKNTIDKQVERVSVNKFAKTTLDFKFKHNNEMKTDNNQDSTNMITNQIITNVSNVTNPTTVAVTLEHKFRIEDMLTLSIIKFSNIGQVKKMIYSNSLKIYTIRVIILIFIYFIGSSNSNERV